MNVIIIIGLVVGFERNYTVSEDEGQVQVCVTVINPPPDQDIGFIFIFASTVPGTAGKLHAMVHVYRISYDKPHKSI